MRPLLLAAAAAANLAATARAAEPAAKPAPPAAPSESRPVTSAKDAATPGPEKPALARPEPKPAPSQEGKGAATGSSRAAPPKVPEAKPCEPVKPCSID